MPALDMEGLLSGGSFASAVVTGNVVPGGATGQAVANRIFQFSHNVSSRLDALREVAETIEAVEGLLPSLKAGGSAGVLALVALVVKTIQRIRPSVEAAVNTTKFNYNNARAMLMGGANGAGCGRIPLVNLPGIDVDHWAGYRFVRSFILDGLARDHIAFYPDPWGTYAPTDFWRGNGTLYPDQNATLIRPYGQLYQDRGWNYDDPCIDWVLLQIDTGSGDCVFPSPEAMTIVWPFAWPLTSPVRCMGTFTKSAEAAAEQIAAGVYSLPTYQHVTTLWSDVIEAERYIRATCSAQYPGAYMDEFGYMRWAGGEKNEYWQGPTPPPLESYSAALQRIYGFKRTRLALRLAVKNGSAVLLPQEVRTAMIGDDWA